MKHPARGPEVRETRWIKALEGKVESMMDMNPRIIGALIAIIATIVPLQSAHAEGELCLPASNTGQTTSVSFQGTNFGRGSFTGITVTSLRVPGASATIASRASAVYFSGGLFFGQYISLPTSYDLIWTGVSTTNHMNGVCATHQYYSNSI